MRTMGQFIRNRNEQYKQHPFIQFLQNKTIPPATRLGYLPHGIYFVMTFGDVNRFLLPKHDLEDPIQDMINLHGSEDSKHWAWFLKDIDALNLNPRGSLSDAIKFIWSPESKETRLFCYRLIQECMNASPIEKLVIIEAMEAMGNVWLVNSVAVATELGVADKLTYLGQHHLDREIGHAMGTETETIDMIDIPPSLRSKCESVVLALYDGMEAFNQDMLNQVLKTLKSTRKEEIYAL